MGEPQLYEHQRSGISFLAKRRSALLADDMGLGKTMQAILASEMVRGNGQTIVCCPASLQYNWRAELSKWAPRASVEIASKSRRPTANYVIVSYDSLKRQGILRETLTKKQWRVAIHDESHYLKNTESARHQGAMALRAEYVWQLTGTPILSYPWDLFGLLRIGGHPLSADEDLFVDTYCGGDENKREATNVEDLAGQLDDWLLRRRKEDCVNLPEKMRVTVTAPAGEGDYSSLGEMMRARSQIATQKSSTTAAVAASCVAGGEKAVVFSAYTEPLQSIRSQLEGMGLRVACIDGQTPNRKRQQVCDNLEAGSLDVVCGQTVAAGQGLNLQEANHVIFNDLALVPAQHLQAEDRCHRIGSTQPVTVHYMLADNALDETVWELLGRKLETIRRFEGSLGPDNGGTLSQKEILRRATLRRKEQLEESLPIHAPD